MKQDTNAGIADKIKRNKIPESIANLIGKAFLQTLKIRNSFTILLRPQHERSILMLSLHMQI